MDGGLGQTLVPGVYDGVPVECEPIETTTPRMQVWAFPEAFYVTACVIDMTRLKEGIDKAYTRWLYRQERFEGGPK